MTALFDLRNPYTGSKTVGVTTIRQTTYMIRKGWLETPEELDRLGREENIPQKKQLANHPQSEVIRNKRPDDQPIVPAVLA